jgi:hypothetical protein
MVTVGTVLELTSHKDDRRSAAGSHPGQHLVNRQAVQQIPAGERVPNVQFDLGARVEWRRPPAS